MGLGMISVVVRVECETCGRKVHGVAPLGWTTEARVEDVALDETGWQMHTSANTVPDEDETPSTYARRAFCPLHRERFGQDFPAAKRITMPAPAVPHSAETECA